MSTMHQALLALQALDAEIDSSKRRIAALKAELADDTALSRARKAAEGSRTEFERCRKALADGEARLSELGATIGRLERRLFDGTIHNVREAASVEEELGFRRREREQLEEVVLREMERLDELQPSVDRAETALADLERQRTQRVSTIKAEGRAATERLNQLQGQRNALASSAPASILTRYEQLHHGVPPAVVQLNGGNCGACGVTIPTATRQKVASDDLVQCPNCRRIIVMG
jgi:predicted  nucleic acid-binding Zn-ribbon protein